MSFEGKQCEGSQNPRDLPKHHDTGDRGNDAAEPAIHNGHENELERKQININNFQLDVSYLWDHLKSFVL